MAGFVATLSYNTLKHIIPQDPIDSHVFLVPDELTLPFPDIIKPNYDIPKTHLKKIDAWLGTNIPFTWDNLMAYWFAFYNHPTIQTIKYFRNEVIYIRAKNGEFIRELGKPLMPAIRQYRASHPHKKDTDLMRAIIRKDDELYSHPYTLTWIRDYYQKNWDFQRMKPYLESIVGIHDETYHPHPYFSKILPEDTETYKQWCPKVNNE